MDKGKPVSFDLLRINKGMKKICRCNPPHYELSVENRIIMCSDCGAVVDPFEAMLSIAGYHEQLREETKRLKEKVKVYSEEANKELKRMRKSRVFREMEEAFTALRAARLEANRLSAGYSKMSIVDKRRD